MIDGVYTKHPSAVLDYSIDWSAWLASGATISASTWTMPAGLTDVSDSHTTTSTSIRISGGVAGNDYEVINAITDSAGETEYRSILLRVRSAPGYCGIAEVKELAQAMTPAATPAAPDGAIQAWIDYVSRMFDKYVGVSDGYFGAADANASARVFWGDGTNYLRVDHYVAGSLNPTITMPPDFTVLEFSESGNGYLIRANNGLREEAYYPWAIGGWPAGVPVTVTARWGFAATPPDVKYAIIEWVINIWRETDPATTKLTGLDGATLRESMPPRVMEIATQRSIGIAQFV